MSKQQAVNIVALGQIEEAIEQAPVAHAVVTTPALGALQLSLDKVSHAVRSNLAIMKAVTDDLVSGYKCEAHDIQLAAQALERTIDTLRVLSDYGAPLTTIIKSEITIKQTLSILLCACQSKGAELYSEVSVSPERTLPLMLVYALRGIVTYAAVCASRRIQSVKNHVKLDLCTNSSGRVCAQISFFRSQGFGSSCLSANTANSHEQSTVDVLDYILTNDSDPATLGLLYAMEAIGGNGGVVGGEWAQGRFIVQVCY